MPFISGHFMSKKELEKDERFLKSQGLSNEQYQAVSIYLQQRVASKSNFTAIWIIMVFLIIGGVSYQMFSSFLNEQKERDSKRLCINNPFLQQDE
jgi:hypothetical protein